VIICQIAHNVLAMMIYLRGLIGCMWPRPPSCLILSRANRVSHMGPLLIVTHMHWKEEKIPFPVLLAAP
jgi:hypothetical protein